MNEITLEEIHKIVSNCIESRCDSVLIRPTENGNIHLTVGLYDSSEMDFINMKITSELKIVVGVA